MSDILMLKAVTLKTYYLDILLISEQFFLFREPPPESFKGFLHTLY